MPFMGSLPNVVDTVVVGNGPAALILSYILHGNCPFYSTAYNAHPDPLIDSKLKQDLIYDAINFKDLTAHFPCSRFSYSTAALPINVLLDTILRPLADTDPEAYKTCVEWRRLPDRAVPHVLLGSTQPGGQWAGNPVHASWDIGALSYLDQLSLPGYSLREHLKSRYSMREMDYVRPTRAEVADYLGTYPSAVGIVDSISPPAVVSDVRRTNDGFYIGSHSIACKHLVLASGIFSNLLPARPQLQPLLKLPECETTEPPLLVIGSGFSAADIIITNLSRRKIIHIFKWDPRNRPSPLRACHKQAYPEYAGVYRQMKLAATVMIDEGEGTPALARRKSNTLRNTKAHPNYEGFPNTFVAEASTEEEFGSVVLCLPSGEITRRTISNLAYVIGRRGSLGYLDPSLQKEVLGTGLSSEEGGKPISGRTLRPQVEENFEVVPNVFVIGSLTGDSLIRHAYGSCVYAARQIMARSRAQTVQSHNDIILEPSSMPSKCRDKVKANAPTSDPTARLPCVESVAADYVDLSRREVQTGSVMPTKRAKRCPWDSKNLRRIIAPLKRSTSE